MTPGKAISIKLHGEKAQRFREIKRDLTAQLGYEPSNAETVGLLMSEYPGDTSQEDRDYA